MSAVIEGDRLAITKKESLNEMFWNSVKKHSGIDAVRFRSGNSYTAITYKKFGEKVSHLSQGLISLGMKKGDKAGILADTSYEWALSDFAILTAGGVSVTIYPTLTPNKISYITENSDSKVIFVQDQEQLEKVLSVRGDLPGLKWVITFEETGSTAEGVYTLTEVIKLGAEFEKENPGRYEEVWKSVEPDDLSSIVYTSGTTGLPKGAMLSHWNWRFNISTVIRVITFEAGNVLLAFLPLAHVYMRLVYFGALHAGATFYFSQPQKLAEDLPAIRPDVFVSVPRLFERVYDRIVDQMEQESPVKKVIFYRSAEIAREVGAYRSKGKALPLKLLVKKQIADKLVFSKIRSKMGVDNLKWTVSAGSALSKDLAFFFSGLGILIIEGYGMTETCGSSNLNPVKRIKPGTVGPPLAGTMQKLADDGEILIKGDHLMQGYYKLPEESADSFTDDGWLKTGDIGSFDSEGYLTFRERKKHILVLSTGKNIAPLPIEESLKKNRWVDDAVVIGDDRKYVTALIQPSFGYLVEFAEKKGIVYNKELTKTEEGAGGDQVIVKIDEALLNDENVLKIYLEVIEAVNKNFESFEKVKRFKLLNEALSMDRGELTPTFKVKRNVVAENYKNLIDSMYEL